MMSQIMGLFQAPNTVPAVILAAVSFVLGAIVMCLVCKISHRPCGAGKKGSCKGNAAPRKNLPPATRVLPPSDGTTEVYVGNLSYDLTEQALTEAFAKYGKVTSVRIVMNRYTNKSKGFGFVHMPNRAEADAAIAALNDTDIGGRKLKCNIAKHVS